MAERQKKRIIRYLLVPAGIFIAPGVLFMLYKTGEALVASIMLTVEKGEIGPMCFMLAVPGLILGFIGVMFWIDEVDTEDNMWWY